MEHLAENGERIIGPAHYDRLQADLGMDMRDPLTFRAHYEVQELQQYIEERPCSEGHCVELIDTRTGENTGGWGPVGCPCQDEDSRPIPPEVSAEET